jgi:hypothetical protein
MGSEYKSENYKSFDPSCGSLGNSKSCCFMSPIKGTVYARSGNPFLNNNEKENNYSDASRVFKINNKSSNNILNCNYVFENNSKTDSNYNQVNFNNGSKLLTENQDNATLTQYEIKIQSIEKKIGKFENDLRDIKTYIQKLFENVNKFVKGSVNNNNLNQDKIPLNLNNFNSMNSDENNEFVNLILNECNKLINDKMNSQTQTNFTSKNNDNNSYFDNRKSSVKKSRNNQCYDNNQNNECEENNSFINQSI